MSSSGSEEESDDDDDEDDDEDDDDDDRSSSTGTSDDMPKLVGRDESSHASRSSSDGDDDSMPQLSKREQQAVIAAARKKRTATITSATATPAPKANTTTTKKKKVKKKKKKKVVDIPMPLSPEEVEAAKRAAEEEERRAAEKLLKDNRDMSYARYFKLAEKVAQKVGIYTHEYIPRFDKPEGGLNISSETQALDGLFNLTHEGEPLWCLLDDSASSQILKAALKSSESLTFFKTHASQVLEAFSNNKVRQEDITILLTAKLTFNAKSVYVLFSNVEKDRADPFNNNTAKTLSSTCTIKMESKTDNKLVLNVIHECLGKKAKKEMTEAVNQAFKNFMQLGRGGGGAR